MHTKLPLFAILLSSFVGLTGCGESECSDPNGCGGGGSGGSGGSGLTGGTGGSGLTGGMGGGGGSDGSGGTGGGGGIGGSGGDPGESADPRARIIFATSSKHDGNLGGLAGADEICQTRAEEAGLLGTFKAFMVDSSEDLSRLEQAEVPYVRVDGARVASSFSKLPDQPIGAPVNVDENGNLVTGNAWTGLRNVGGSPCCNNACDDWTYGGGGCLDGAACGGGGETGKTDNHWDGFFIFQCSSMWSLYCIQQEVRCTDDGECDDGGICTSAACDGGTCRITQEQDGTTCDEGNGACQSGLCAPIEFECDMDGDCADGNDCTLDSCQARECVNESVSNGSSCDSGQGMCQSGVCEPVDPGCQSNAECSDGNECTDDVCLPGAGTCENVQRAEGAPCAAGSRVCKQGVCSTRCSGIVCMDDGNQCTTEACNEATGMCVSSPADGSPCSGGTCAGDICQPNDILHIDFEGDVSDVGNRWTVRLTNSPAFVRDRKGAGAGAADFYAGGSSGAGVLASTSSLNLAGDQTIAMWVRFENVGAARVVGTNDGLQFYISSSRMQFGWARNDADASSDRGPSVSSATLQASTNSNPRWYHFVGVRSGSQLRMYQDGALVGSVTSNQSISTACNFYMGTWPDGNRCTGVNAAEFNNPPTVYDDVRVFNRALTQSQISALYQDR